jgi:hypothetical protein
VTKEVPRMVIIWRTLGQCKTNAEIVVLIKTGKDCCTGICVNKTVHTPAGLPIHNAPTATHARKNIKPRHDCNHCLTTMRQLRDLSEACKSATMCIEIRRSQKHNEQMAECTVFTVQGNPIEQVNELGRMITETDDDWCAVNRNLKHTQQRGQE